MSPQFRSRAALGLAICLSLAGFGCSAKDSGGTSIAPSAPPAGTTTTATLSGTVIACGAALPRVKISVTDEASGQVMGTAFSTPSGRWLVEGLDAGTYRLDFEPPAPVAGDPSTELRSVLRGGVELTAGETVLQPIVFAPVVGGFLLEDSGPFLTGVKFRVDPFNLTSAIVPGLEDLTVIVPAGLRIFFEGDRLVTLGIDDDPNTLLPVRELLIEIAVLSADQLPAGLVDANGNGVAGETFYALYPTGFCFQNFAGAPNPLQLSAVNGNGLTPSVAVNPRAFDYHQFAWGGAGVGTISAGGATFGQTSPTGLAELGVLAVVGPPTPRTDVVGQITTAAVPVARAGISVVTNTGFFGVTDETGAYRIEDVPIPLNNRPLVCTAFTDRGLAFETASSGAAPLYPETTIDIDIAVIDPVAAPNCDLASSEPASGATDVHTNERIRLRFDREMDTTTLAGAISMSATPVDGEAVDIATTLVTRGVVGVGGARMTDVFVLPAVNSPVDADVSLSVSTDARDVEGNPLAAVCTLPFRTGASTLLLPDVYLVDPLEGPVETVVTLRGTNFELVSSVMFDGASITPVIQETNRLTFVVPLSEGTEAPGPRTILLAPVEAGAPALSFTILPRIDAVQIDSDPDPMIETLVNVGAAQVGTSVAGVDQNDGSLIIITGQNLFDPIGMALPVVTFGAGDGDPMSGVDGDAALDAIDESAQADRIEVRTPPAATTGPVTVLVDFGGAAPVSVTASSVAVELPVDSTAPVLDMPSLAPPPGDTGVLSTQIITAMFDEPVAGDSRLIVGTGVPLRTILGTTLVTTTPDGVQGIMQFFPAAGALPTSSTVFVQVSASAVTDLADNVLTSFDFTFSTGVAAPVAGGSRSDGSAGSGTESGPFKVEESKSITGAAGTSVASSAPPVREDQVLRALGAHGAAWARMDARDASVVATGGIAVRAEVVLGVDVRSPLSVSDGTVLDWGGRAAAVRWESHGSRAIFIAQQRAETGELETFVRLDLPAGSTEPGRYAYRLELAPTSDGGAESAGGLSGLVTDLDADGRLELSLFTREERRPRLGGVLFREDLVQGGPGFIELRIPDLALSGLEGDAGRALKFRLESFDLRELTYDLSPEFGLIVAE